MKVLITAGGTREDIDPIRSITNRSTGRLGSIIADKFAHEGAAVTYLCGSGSALPTVENIKIIKITNTQSLLLTISSLLEAYKYDCVIHSMAVSDYAPQAVISVDDIIENILSLDGGPTSTGIRAAITAAEKPLGSEKISSKHKDLMIQLRQTPKIIKLIKEIQPDTILVGFKLLSEVSNDELLQAAQDILVKNNCDYVIANDLKDIKGDTHKAFLINKNGILQSANTKHEIANIIYKTLRRKEGTA